MDIVGKKIVAVRQATKREQRAEGWDDRTFSVIQLEDGTVIYASRDAEGNGPGELFAVNKKNDESVVL